MPKLLKYFLIVALAAFIIMQFIRPTKNNAGYETLAVFENETKPTPEMAAILRTNCYDCHSNQTNYPWYAEVAPVNYWLADHVKDGKKHFNVSAWGKYSAKRKDHKLEELIEFVEEGEMPLDSYTWVHGQLPEEDAKALTQWAQMLRIAYQKEMAELAK
ncbi:MAG: hypothetical protein ACI9M9_000133 [Flavobacteriaceae bacterium]|jgi:hypothetical protein